MTGCTTESPCNNPVLRWVHSDRCQIGCLGRTVTGMRKLLREAERQRNDLLARIHRDGGHYVEEHGVEKACLDADLKVAEAYGRIAELENDVALLEKHAEKLRIDTLKVEALRERDVLLVEKERLTESNHNLRTEIRVLTQERDKVERAARSLLSRKDFWISAATLMTLPGELDNLADLLTPEPPTAPADEEGT